MSNIKVVCKNLNGHPIEFVRKMNELSHEIEVSWSIEGGASNKKYRIDIFWEDTSLNEKVEEVIDSFSSYFVNPEVIEINMGGYEEKQPSNVEEKKQERKRKKDYEITKPVETKVTEVESEGDYEFPEENNFESEILEEETSKMEIAEPTETESEVDSDSAEESNSESEIHEEKTPIMEIDEPTETESEVDSDSAEESNSESEIYEEETSGKELDELTETESEVDSDSIEESNSQIEIHEDESSKTEITENQASANANETNEVGESPHSENANEPQQVICEKADIEESKKAFLDLISSKIPEATPEKIILEDLCSNLSIESVNIKKGIKYSCNKKVKNLNDLFKQVGTELHKNTKLIEVNMNIDLKNWVATYPIDTPKEFTLTLQEFFNLFRRDLKKF